MTTMSPLPPDPYKALGVGKEADTSAIKTAYRKLVLKCHPDKVQDPAQKAIKQDEFQRVQQAYEILSDDSKRREYDNEVNLKRLREEFHKAMPNHHSSTRPPPKNYYEYNVRTAEPPPSFRPGPPPAAPRSPYPGNPQFSASWEHEMPSRTKPIYDEERKPRRTASHENPRKEEESKEERRRRKEKEADALRREKEKEKEEREKRRADRERRERDERKEQEKKDRIREERERARRDEERRVKKERDKERERREKERDELRRRQQDAKSESKKPIYVEHHEESGEEERRVPKKKASSENKKHHDSPRRAKSSGRMGSGDDLATKEKWDSNLRTAAEYMRVSRRKGSGSGPSATYYPDPSANFSENFPDPEAWHAEKPPRSRRPSHDDKKYRTTVEEEPEIVDASPKGPPPLRKAFTSPVGGIHNMANSSAPRAPNLARAHTMQPDLRVPPTAPPAPTPDAARHSKAERRPRRASLDADYDDEPVRRSRARGPNIVRYKLDDDDIHPRVQSHYRSTEEAFYSSPASGGGAKFSKVKVASYDKPLYQAKHYEPDDVSFTPMESPYRSGGSYNFGYVHAG